MERDRGDRAARGDRIERRDRIDRGPRVGDGRIDREPRRAERFYGSRPDRPWRRGQRYTWGPGAVFYFYDGYYYGNCRWLLRRAQATGSPYWWRRYRACRSTW